MTLLPRNMTSKHGSLDTMPIESLDHALTALISSQETLVLDAGVKRKMYVALYLGNLKEICSYVEWNSLCHGKNFVLHFIKLSDLNWIKSAFSFAAIYWN